MKRIIVFVLLMMLVLPETGLAKPQYMTMREVHDEVADQYSDGWHETIQTKWRVIEIHTPVIVPDADQCPVLALQLMADHPDLAALPGEGWQDNTTADGWVRASRSDTEAAPGTKNSEIDSHHFYAPVDLDMAWDGFGGKTLGELIREGGEVLALSCGEKYSWDLAPSLRRDVQHPHPGQRNLDHRPFHFGLPDLPRHSLFPQYQLLSPLRH
jgi:hypothetical protein